MVSQNMKIEKLVKIKKLQKHGQSCLAVIIPANWIEMMNWNRETKLVLEILPHRKLMLLSENEKVSDIVTV